MGPGNLASHRPATPATPTAARPATRSVVGPLRSATQRWHEGAGGGGGDRRGHVPRGGPG
ncbi:hypothetical protein FTX61_19390 [Nitriliruptoraceae bacterium ZYF776]|nr:hypothetical protein [Profundirhabdus halotolerans]